MLTVLLPQIWVALARVKSDSDNAVPISDARSYCLCVIESRIADLPKDDGI